jgi:indolepyruvate ferredoxin oxidoreductase beta subunit
MPRPKSGKIDARNAALDAALAREIADCARLIKGYGDNHRRGAQNFALIKLTLIAPALAGRADPEGGALAEELAPPVGKAAE